MRKELNSGIYIIENTKNGKVYVGQSINLNKRWSSHKSAYKRYTEGRESCWHQALWNAFSKYGLDNFQYKIIAKCPKEYLDKMEIKIIELHNSYNKGYNCDRGGKGGVVAKPIYQYDTKGNTIKKWETLSDACHALGFKSENNIRNAAKNNNTQHTAYGFIWSFKDDGILKAECYRKMLDNRLIRVTEQSKKVIKMFDFEGRLLKTFDSITSCAKHLKCDIKNLSTSITNSYGASHGVILIKPGKNHIKALEELSKHRVYKKLIINKSF